MNPGEKIGQYTVIDQIGIGGMGTVYKCSHDITNEIIALKICNEKEENYIRRFTREVKIQENVDHKNIVKILDKNLDNDPPYFTMSLAQGSATDISSTLCGDINKAYDIFKEVCDGISALHLSGNYHRDIKPSNILIYADGSIKVSDLGLAKMAVRDSSPHGSSNRFIGTIGYNAPEQIIGKNADHRTDVFQLGKTFYQLFTCDYPHLINPKLLPSGLVYIIQKATSHDPNDRYQSVSDLKQAIFTFIKSLNPSQNPVEALESKLFEIDKMQKNGIYDEDIYISFLDLLDSIKGDKDAFFKVFDKIPKQALKVYSDQLADRFLPFLTIYTEVLQAYFEEKFIDFSYAEVVANNMEVIFKSATRPELKGLAVKNTLRVAHWLNRFNAMDTFDSMLKDIKLDDEARYISQILNDEIEIYKHHSDRIADKYLHAAIVNIKNHENQGDIIDNNTPPDWLGEWLQN